MVCPGIVTNVTNFGAFVDIGVHQDGLVHISQLADKFVKDPREVVSPGDRVTVRVLEVKREKNQIALTMKAERAQGAVPSAPRATETPPAVARVAVAVAARPASNDRRRDPARAPVNRVAASRRRPRRSTTRSPRSISCAAADRSDPSPWPSPRRTWRTGARGYGGAEKLRSRSTHASCPLSPSAGRGPG